MTKVLKHIKKNGGPQALTVRRIDGERVRSGGESRKTGVWQQLGLKRVRGSMQKQVRAAGAIQLTAQPRQAMEHDPRIMMTCTEMSPMRTICPLSSLCGWRLKDMSFWMRGPRDDAMRPGNPRPNGSPSRSPEARRG